MLLGGSQYALALTNIMANVILCIAGLYLAIGIVKLIG
jgi:fluoride ion exporter CrcB/FEX